MNTSVARYALGAVGAARRGGAAVAAAAVAIRRRWLGDWTGAPARLAEAVIGLALLIGILEVLGAVGLFELGPIVIACVLAGVAGVRSARARRRCARHPGDAARWRGLGCRPWSRSSAGATVLAEWGALTIQSYDVGIRGFDSLWYHLPWAASFAQTGNIAVAALHRRRVPDAVLSRHRRDAARPRDRAARARHAVARAQPRLARAHAAGGVLHRPPARRRRRHDDRRGAGDGRRR